MKMGFDEVEVFVELVTHTWFTSLISDPWCRMVANNDQAKYGLWFLWPDLQGRQ